MTSRHPLIRQGEGPAQAYERLTRERHQERRRIEQAMQDSPQLERKSFGTPPGDERKLRGIPAIGRNVSGAIPGTSPHSQR
jgi:hypothetical protein